MKNVLITFFLIVWVYSFGDQQAETVDVIYINGRIYTVNEAQPWAEAVAIKDGKFIKVGSNNDVLALKGEKTIAIDLKGQFSMPGIVDMHAHPFTGVDMGIGLNRLHRLAYYPNKQSPLDNTNGLCRFLQKQLH